MVAEQPPGDAREALSLLRDLERRAAASRPAQLASASPSLAQLLASIGACEAAHVVALPKKP
ncbi:hypothetical protein D5H75_26725 [Bailinhaonella thermotolerans]|uniref:Uncharacterized protein n=1 Tax=Bailinhaonella thermotolerans TaxID=1070861 RepID=A0A3A4ABE5_9ACTN|nr:hypothetical protein D5H75_26725 [Bailinhaonella thermotolerans]